MIVAQIAPSAAERAAMSNSYIARDLQQENETVKQLQRDRVIEHFQQYRKGKSIRLMSLPGAWWSFEKQVQNNWSNAQFVAIERTYGLLQHGIPHMPGLRAKKYAEHLNGVTFDGYSTDRARVLWSHASLFMGLTPADIPAKATEYWRRTYGNWSAVWWDFTANINEETVDTLLATEKHLDPSKYEVPVSITLCNGREQGKYNTLIQLLGQSRQSHMQRAEFLEMWINHSNTLRTVEVTDVYPYQSVAGGNMVLINTVFRDRKPRIQNGK